MSALRGLCCAALAALSSLPASAQSGNLGGTSSAANQPLQRPASYRLVWSDEFNRPGAPDPKKWRYDASRNKAGWYNGELQYYAADRRQNARVENGRLIIEARRERLSGKPDFGGQNYSSAKLVTQGVAAWKHGFFEIRAKLPCGRGLWPAFWTLPVDNSGGWPASGEIDIMEHVGWDPGRIHGTIHTKAYNHAINTQKGAERLVPSACSAFHTYQLDWNAQRILIGMDGRAYMRFANDGRGNAATWPFTRAHYLILNLAVGGWGGQKGIDANAFPGRMEVEYVRVWQHR